MTTDPWQQWQSYAALMGGAGAPAAASFAPSADFAERFKQAAQAYLSAVATSATAAPQATQAQATQAQAAQAQAAQAQAARRFSDSLRDLFIPVQPSWNGSGPWNGSGSWNGSGPWNGPGSWNGGGPSNGANPWSGASPFGAPGVSPAFSPNSPAVGPTREHQLRSQRLADACRQLDEAQRRLQRLWMDALRDAATAFAANLSRPASWNADPEGVRQLYDMWIDCAEDAYSKIAHSPPFCDAFAESVNAGSRCRRELQSIFEQSAKLLDLPTRSELNTLQQRVRALETELQEARRPSTVSPVSSASPAGSAGPAGSASAAGSANSRPSKGGSTNSATAKTRRRRKPAT